MGMNNEGMPMPTVDVEAKVPLTPEELAATPYGKLGYTGEEYLRFDNPETGETQQGTVAEFFDKCPHAKLLPPAATKIIIQESMIERPAEEDPVKKNS
jgi:hypothetical protein